MLIIDQRRSSLHVVLMAEPPGIPGPSPIVGVSLCDSSPIVGVSLCDSSPIVGVSLCDSSPLLWRAGDLRAVRAEGLVGSLIGALTRTPRQNARMGRPLLLLPEERRLLANRHAAATLPHANQAGGAGLTEQLAYHAEQQRRSYEQQSVLALTDRKAQLTRAMMSSHTDCVSGPEDESLRSRLEALDQSFTLPLSAMAVQLSTGRAGLSHCPEARRPLQPDRPMRGEERADRPITGEESLRSDARYQVFRDLRGRGFYLTSAGKFGGDFLVYPGDPLRFHAHYIAVCLSAEEPVCLLDLLAVARLGSNVKKTVLLCSPRPEGGVLYTSLQWSGMV